MVTNIEYTKYSTFPKQNISYKQKTKKWREECVLWAAGRSFTNFNPVRSTMVNKKINYDLMSGIVHMDDIKVILNPKKLEFISIPETIQHYPVINTRIETLIGEMSALPFDYRVVVTNPNALSEMEEAKKMAIQQSIQQTIQETVDSDEEFQERMAKQADYFNYEYQDFREVRCNQLLSHYSKEYNIPLICANGFRDLLVTGEEVYKCDIVGGEPTFERVNNCKLSVWGTGTSNKIEDADIIIYEDYLSPGQIVDRYHEYLSQSDINFIESGGRGTATHPADTYGLLLPEEARMLAGDDLISRIFGGSYDSNGLAPFDTAGNIRVMQVYWKSKRKILKVKQYNVESGEEEFDLFPETYKPDEDAGEEIVQTMWVNQAWQGTLIGGYTLDETSNSDNVTTQGLVINVRPCPVQFNSMSNPSKCHFGFIGTVANMNDDKPYSLVDKMKPMAYMYDVIMYNLLDAISTNFGSILEMDIDTIPEGWDVARWFAYAKNYHLSIKSSAKMGTGEAAGKLIAAVPNAGNKVLDTPVGDYIQQLLNLLDWITTTMSELVGITRQRVGNVQNRETKGGIERSVIQSSYVTKWLFDVHQDTIKRALECFLEVAKIAMRGKNKKFNYITSDQVMKILEIDGDEFAECDYGLVVDNSQSTNMNIENINSLALASAQNGSIDLSAYMRIMQNTLSLAEKVRIIERSEQQRQEQAQQQQQQQLQIQQQEIQADIEQKEQELQAKLDMNTNDNNTKILVAQIQAQATLENAAYTANSFNGISGDETPESIAVKRREIEEKIREFDLKYKLDKEKLEVDKQKVSASKSNKKK